MKNGKNMNSKNSKTTKKATKPAAKSKQVKTTKAPKAPTLKKQHVGRVTRGLRDLLNFGTKAADAFKKGDLVATLKALSGAVDAGSDIEIPLESAVGQSFAA